MVNMANRKQLLDSALKQIKSPSAWGKMTGLVTVLVLLLQAYHDIRTDVQSAREGAQEAKEEVGQTEESLQRKGKLSEKETEAAVVDLQDKLQFLYTESTLLKDRVEDLELENRRLFARLKRYYDLPGKPERNLRNSARLSGGAGAGGGAGMGMSSASGTISEDSEDSEDSVSPPPPENEGGFLPEALPQMSAEKSEYVDSNGNLRFEPYQGTW